MPMKTAILNSHFVNLIEAQAEILAMTPPKEQAEQLKTLCNEWDKIDLIVVSTRHEMEPVEKQLFIMSTIAWLAGNRKYYKPYSGKNGWLIDQKADLILRKMLVAIHIWRMLDVMITDDIKKIANQLTIYEEVGGSEDAT